MFLSLETPVAITLIAIIAAQYGFAVFCLTKLAVLDLSHKDYILWNIFILLVFFIGGIVFIVYYMKVKDTKRVPPYDPQKAADTASDTAAEVASDTAAPSEEPPTEEPPTEEPPEEQNE